jgi:hypothetical protein
MRKFRIKEGAEIENLDGLEIGGVYGLIKDTGGRVFLEAGKDNLWCLLKSEVEEVIEENTKSKKFKFLGDFSSINDGTYAGFEIGKVYNYDDECPNKVGYYVDEYPNDWEEVVEKDITYPTYTTLCDSKVNYGVISGFSIGASNGRTGVEPSPVNPQHYKNGEVECIEAIKSAVVGKDGFSGYLVGNCIKYLFRYESKGGVTDLEKSNWYLNKLIDYEKNKER